MKQLNEKQIGQVTNYVIRSGGRLPSTRDELIDHICCSIESRMSAGESFPEAFSRSCEEMNESEVKRIIHSLTKKRRFMLHLLLGISTTTVLLFLIFPSDEITLPATTEGLTAQFELFDPPSENPLGDEFRMSSGFGQRVHPISKEPKMHRGVDWVAPLGTPVYAAGAGRVEEAGAKGQYGNYIRITHDEIYATAYAQLSEVLVAPGEEVTAGQLIGRVGSSGASTGPHLHYEVIKNGEAVNPQEYLP